MRTRAPRWFWIVAALLVLWGFGACASFWAHVSFDPDDPAFPAYDRQLYKLLPGWLNWVYALAVGAVLAGAIAMLLRRGVALPLFAVSLGAAVMQFGWTLGTTDLIAVKGWAVAAVPAVIIGLGAFALWLAKHARRRGWIG